MRTTWKQLRLKLMQSANSAKEPVCRRSSAQFIAGFFSYLLDMIEHGIKFSMSSRSFIFQESRVSLGRTLPRRLVWERVDYLCSYSASGCFVTVSLQLNVSLHVFLVFLVTFHSADFHLVHHKKTQRSESVTTLQTEAKKKKNYNAPAKMQLKGKCISGFEVLLKPPKWKLIMFYSFSVLLLCKKNKKRKWTKL